MYRAFPGIRVGLKQEDQATYLYQIIFLKSFVENLKTIIFAHLKTK